jgi:hypothetical protein
MGMGGMMGGGMMGESEVVLYFYGCTMHADTHNDAK